MFILDTDHIGIVQWESEPEYSRLMARFGLHADDDFFVTVVSLHEEFLGWNSYISKAKKLDGVVKGYDRFLKILSDFEVSQIQISDLSSTLSKASPGISQAVGHGRTNPLGLTVRCRRPQPFIHGFGRPMK